MEPFWVYIDSPLGLIEIGATADGISSLLFVEQRRSTSLSSPLLEMAQAQLDEYFSGRRRQFDLPFDLHGSAFQQRVWAQVNKIPYGQTLSYADIARALGNPRSTRAVGMAVGKNPVAILVPCHRVIGSDGSLTGYGGGLWRKTWLLRHEGCWSG